jgi:hypothetical protein
MVSGKESTRLFDDLLFPKIFRTFRVAIQPTKLIIAFLAVVVICLAGWVMDLGKTVVVGTYGPDEVFGDTGTHRQVPGGRRSSGSILNTLAFWLGQVSQGPARAV